MLDSIYHMTFKVFCNRVFGVKTSICRQIYVTLLWASFYNVTKICKSLFMHIYIYLYSCLNPLSIKQKSMFKSGDSRAV